LERTLGRAPSGHDYRADSCVPLGETTEVAGTTFGPIILEAFYLGCGLKAGLKAPAQSLTHVRWMAISITNQFLPKGVLRDLFQSKIVKANKPVLQLFKFMDNRFFTAERPLTFQVDALLSFEKRRRDPSSESFSTSFTDFMRLHDKFCEAQRTQKSNKNFVCTALDIWDRLHTALEYSLTDNAVLDTIIENLVAAIHDNDGDITQKMLDDFVEKIVLRKPRFRGPRVNFLLFASPKLDTHKDSYLLRHCNLQCTYNYIYTRQTILVHPTTLYPW
jgi:hypothetical protein